jgi:hypothetical protein
MKKGKRFVWRILVGVLFFFFFFFVVNQLVLLYGDEVREKAYVERLWNPSKLIAQEEQSEFLDEFRQAKRDNLVIKISDTQFKKIDFQESTYLLNWTRNANKLKLSYIGRTENVFYTTEDRILSVPYFIKIIDVKDYPRAQGELGLEIVIATELSYAKSLFVSIFTLVCLFGELICAIYIGKFQEKLEAKKQTT